MTEVKKKLDKIKDFNSYNDFEGPHAGTSGTPYPAIGLSKNPEEETSREETPKKEPTQKKIDFPESQKKVLKSPIADDLSAIETYVETIKNATRDMEDIPNYAKLRIMNAMKDLKRAHIFLMDIKRDF